MTLASALSLITSHPKPVCAVNSKYKADSQNMKREKHCRSAISRRISANHEQEVHLKEKMEFTGQYRLERDDHFDDYLKEIGMFCLFQAPAKL